MSSPAQPPTALVYAPPAPPTQPWDQSATYDDTNSVMVPILVVLVLLLLVAAYIWLMKKREWVNRWRRRQRW